MKASFLLREVDRNPRHVRVSVFQGAAGGGARGLCGSLLIDAEAWDELVVAWLRTAATAGDALELWLGMVAAVELEQDPPTEVLEALGPGPGRDR